MKKILILLAIVAAVIIAAVVGSSYYRQSVQQKPTQEKAATSEFLVRPDSPAIGPQDAKVTVVEFYDPECEACAAFAPAIKKMTAEYPQVRFVFRYMPFHKNARLAAIYTEAAGEQGKYWEMQEKLFETQPEWGEKHGHLPQPADTTPAGVYFEKYAGELGLDLAQLKNSITDTKHAAKADRDMEDGKRLNVTRTPTFFVNGRQLARLNLSDMRALINEELNK